MGKNRYLFKNTFVFAIGNLSTKFINFILVPMYTYILSSSEYGTIDLIFSICNLITPIIMCNISEAVMRFLMDKNTKERQNKIISSALIFVLIGLVAGTLLIPIFSLFELTDSYSIMLYFFIIFSSLQTVLFCHLRGEEKLKEYTFCNLLSTILIGILNVIFLAKFNMGVSGFLLAYLTSYIITSIIALVLGKQYLVLRNFTFDKEIFYNMLKFSIALVPNALLWWIINSSDRIMISSIVSFSANGLYSIAYKIPSLLSMFSTTFMQAWTYSAIREEDEESPEIYYNYVMKRLFSILCIISGMLLVFLKELYKILYEYNYYQAWEYTPFLILGFLFLAMASFVGTLYYVKKDTLGTMLSSLFGGIVNIILNFILIPTIGANGAAIATCISYLSILVYRLKDTNKYVKINFFNKMTNLSLLCLLCMIYILYKFESTIILIFLFLLICLMNIDIFKEITLIIRKFFLKLK